jgi:hypothetical protein
MISKIERIDQPDHPEHRQHQVHHSGSAAISILCRSDQDKHGEQLSCQLGPWRQHAEIIDESEHDDDGSSEDDAEDVVPNSR